MAYTLSLHDALPICRNKMMNRIAIIYLILLFKIGVVLGEPIRYQTSIVQLPGEKWWGGMVGLGSKMPFDDNLRLFDLSAENLNNQNVPLLISSEGRYLWSEKPFSFEINSNELMVYSKYEKLEPIKAGKNLREAYLSACNIFFKPSGKLPDSLFFSMPQYNTWIELLYDQNQTDILNYANNVLKHQFPVGIFMIDDNWQKHYGNFDFKPDKFPNPKEMIDQLHKEGFRIMLWICPFVSADSQEFKELQKKVF